MIFFTFIVLLGTLAKVMGEAKVQKSKMNILNSDTLPGNLLPNFMFQQG
jgi:hypothetical protein